MIAYRLCTPTEYHKISTYNAYKTKNVQMPYIICTLCVHVVPSVPSFVRSFVRCRPSIQKTNDGRSTSLCAVERSYVLLCRQTARFPACEDAFAASRWYCVVVAVCVWVGADVTAVVVCVAIGHRSDYLLSTLCRVASLDVRRCFARCARAYFDTFDDQGATENCSKVL